MPIWGYGIWKEFGITEEKDIDRIVADLEKNWESWIAQWKEHDMPRGLRCVMFVWGNTKEMVLELVREKFPDRVNDKEFVAKVAVTIDSMVT